MITGVSFLDSNFVKTIKLGVLSKVVSSLTVLLSIPIAIKSLGLDEFSTYAYIVSILGWGLLFNFGIISNVIHQLEEHKETLGSELVISHSVLSQLKRLVFISVFIPVVALLTRDIVSFDKNWPEYMLVWVVFSINWIALPIHGYLNFFKKISYLHVANIASALFSLLVIFSLRGNINDSFHLLLAIYGLPSLISLYFIFKYTKIDLWNATSCQKENLQLRKGKDFFVIDQLNQFVSHIFPVLILTVYQKSDVAMFSVTLTLLSLALSVQQIATRPLKGYLVGLETKDALTLFYRGLKIFSFVSLLIATVIFIFGKYLLYLWLDDVIVFSELQVSLIALYVLLQAIDSYCLNTLPFIYNPRVVSKFILIALLIFTPLLFFTKSYTIIIVWLIGLRFTTLLMSANFIVKLLK